MLERVNARRAIDPDQRPSKLAVNLRVGQELILKPAFGPIIRVLVEAKHGHGARLVVLADRSVEIVTPEV